MILFHVHDTESSPPVSRELGAWTIVALALDRLAAGCMPARHCLFDIDLHDLANVRAVRAGRTLRTMPSGLRIFACRQGDRHASIQAAALAATHVVDRPISDPALRTVLADVPSGDGDEDGPISVVTGALALNDAFRSLVEDAPLEAGRLAIVAGGLAADIDRIGIASWLGSIRRHHEGTYRHCLTVTGVATAFGRRLGLSSGDLADLTVAALLHDVGKARIDLAVLDKPGRLDPAELAMVRRHPEWGDEYLRDRSDVAPAVRAAVRHHHEYLDGSGYPDGIAGRAIGDLTRLVTVADIFSALIERRAYKPSMPAAVALDHLRELARAGKIEGALVEAFAPVAADVAAIDDPVPKPSRFRLRG